MYHFRLTPLTLPRTARLAFSACCVALLFCSATSAQEPTDSAPATVADPAAQQTAAQQLDTAAILEGLRQTPRAVRLAVDQIRPSLVVIESFGGSTVTSGRIRGLRGQGEGNTTGIILSPDGWIITSSFNFVEQPSVVTVVLADGTRHVARLAGRDDTRNVCLLKINDVTDLVVPEWFDPEAVKVGQWAVSVGFGYGDEQPAVSTGIVSALQRASGRAIQTDANLSPANYGGPLLDLHGRVLGVCVPLNPTAPGPAAGVQWYDSGIGFAIPIDPQASWVERLKEGEILKFGFLGVSIKQLPDVEPEQGRLQIESVAEDSPAAAAGIETGDRIIRLGDVPAVDKAQLGVELRRYLAGDALQIELLRGDETIKVPVTLGEPPTSEPEIPPLQIEPVTPEEDDAQGIQPREARQPR